MATISFMEIRVTTDITGGHGADTIYGGQGEDKITDHNGSNLIYGNLANDTING